MRILKSLRGRPQDPLHDFRILTSIVLGAVACGSSLLLLWAALDSGTPGSLFAQLGLPPMPYGKITTMVYLKVSEGEDGPGGTTSADQGKDLSLCGRSSPLSPCVSPLGLKSPGGFIYYSLLTYLTPGVGVGLPHVVLGSHSRGFLLVRGVRFFWREAGLHSLKGPSGERQVVKGPCPPSPEGPVIGTVINRCTALNREN